LKIKFFFEFIESEEFFLTRGDHIHLFVPSHISLSQRTYQISVISMYNVYCILDISNQTLQSKMQTE